MALEIERKFLVAADAWRRAAVSSETILQGYLANTALSSVRVRVAGGRAWLSVKAMTCDVARQEYEYPVPTEDGRAMLAALCEGVPVEKRRHRVPCGAHCFEVDEFLGRNAGLIVAEIELDTPAQSFCRPAWLGEEVTQHLRYYNFRLATEPFDTWAEAAREAATAGRHVGSDPEVAR